ncbi:MAG: Type secretion system protein [Subtercola sp.]|nr:Type secretion system protein [Subtercola sp.]
MNRRASVDSRPLELHGRRYVTRRHMAINIRKFVLQAHHLDELVALGTVTAQAARFLEAAVASGLNVLVSGGTAAAGRTGGRARPRSRSASR